MGYSITVESYFSAAHRLKGYKGKCENVHGHNWRVQVAISCKKLDKIGMAFDFKEAKSLLAKILVLVDHKQLDRLSFFRKKNPTSERIAEFIFNRYQKGLRSPLEVESVSVWETPTSKATFSL